VEEISISYIKNRICEPLPVLLVFHNSVAKAMKALLKVKSSKFGVDGIVLDYGSWDIQRLVMMKIG
jgi:hypothetical protein